MEVIESAALEAARILQEAFPWPKTREGTEYWSIVHSRLLYIGHTGRLDGGRIIAKRDDPAIDSAARIDEANRSLQEQEPVTSGDAFVKTYGIPHKAVRVDKDTFVVPKSALDEIIELVDKYEVTNPPAVERDVPVGDIVTGSIHCPTCGIDLSLIPSVDLGDVVEDWSVPDHNFGIAMVGRDTLCVKCDGVGRDPVYRIFGKQ